MPIGMADDRGRIEPGGVAEQQACLAMRVLDTGGAKPAPGIVEGAGDGDYACVGIDSKESACIVVQAVSDRIATIRIGGIGGDADRGANNGIFTVDTVAALTLTIVETTLVTETGTGDETITGIRRPDWTTKIYQISAQVGRGYASDDTLLPT